MTNNSANNLAAALREMVAALNTKPNFVIPARSQQQMAAITARSAAVLADYDAQRAVDDSRQVRIAQQIPRYVVDGMEFPDNPDGPFIGDGQYPPFVVFDVDRQENLPGEYNTRAEAEQVATRQLFAELIDAAGKAQDTNRDDYVLARPDVSGLPEAERAPYLRGWDAASEAVFRTGLRAALERIEREVPGMPEPAGEAEGMRP